MLSGNARQTELNTLLAYRITLANLIESESVA
jgi:hypothetical protein